MKLLLLSAAAAVANTVGQSAVDKYPDPTSVATTDPAPAPTCGGGMLGWYSWDGRWRNVVEEEGAACEKETASYVGFSSECLPGASYAAHSVFVGCQHRTAFATACESNSVVYNDGSTSDCDLDRCETATVFESSGAQPSSAILCYATAAFRPEPRTFYRHTFALNATTSIASASQTHTVSRTPEPSVPGKRSVTGTQPTAGATPTVALGGGRTVLWAGVTTLVMMALGAVMFI